MLRLRYDLHGEDSSEYSRTANGSFGLRPSGASGKSRELMAISRNQIIQAPLKNMCKNPTVKFAERQA